MKEFIEVLKSCGYDANFVKTKEEAFELAKTYIKPNMSVGLGGSVSVQEIGLLDYLLNNKDITVHNQYEAGITMDENIERRRKGLVSDIFVTSTNAITKAGELVNADGSGNRVAAFSYGPKHVLLIVGVNKIVENDLTENDVVSIGYRKKQLQIFKKMLTDDDLKEPDWQDFFEKNSWIFGYGLSYVFSTNLDDKKLEQVVSGFDFNNSGKRVDGLLKTAGFINSLCFVEIKTHKTPLLKKEYRVGCWNISDEFSGAITQIQNTVYLANKKIQDSVKIKDNEGYFSGEEIFNYNPKAYLVIGKLDEFTKNQEVHYDKYRSFELFRKNVNSPEIITFDELYERAKFIVEVKNT